MCGRYVRKSTRREIAAWFTAEDVEDAAWGESYNVAPQTFQPVVRRHPGTGRREIALLRWGLIPFWASEAKIAFRTINARAETVATAPAFRDACNRRCLVPADAFYEWQARDARRKQPYAIALASHTPFGLAGLWDRWKNPADGQWLETFSIITTAANAAIAPMHDRMPVILEPKDYERWLDAPAIPLDLLRPFPAENMTAWKVVEAVGNVRNDRPELLDPPAAEPAPGQPALAGQTEQPSQPGLFDSFLPPA